MGLAPLETHALTYDKPLCNDTVALKRRCPRFSRTLRLKIDKK